MSFQETKIIFNKQNQRDCPGKVKVVDGMKDNLTALQKLFDHETPTKWLFQGKYVCNTQYGFGGTLVSSFGASWEDQGGQNKYQKGTWRNNMDGKPSNLRGLNNLEEALEILAREWRLTRIEYFIFTENTTAKAA